MLAAGNKVREESTIPLLQETGIRLRKRDRRAVNDANFSSDEISPQKDIKADYQLIRARDLLEPPQKKSTSIWGNIKEIFAEDPPYAYAKPERASLRDIESSLGPQIYRMVLRCENLRLEMTSKAVIHHIFGFSNTPTKVENEHATGRFKSEGNDVFLRAWFEPSRKELELRLHDAARRQHVSTEAQPINRKNLQALDPKLSLFAQYLHRVDSRGAERDLPIERTNRIVSREVLHSILE